jgi:thiol-disulfide isomerase/thioredoxin
VAGLVALLALAAGAFFLGMDRTPAQHPANAALAPLRARAALSPCPTGVSKDLPAVTLACLGGGAPVVLHGPASGVPTLVNVYGSWCNPCQKEMPLLVAFSKAAGGRVALLGVDTEDEQRLALLFAKAVGQTWPAVVDDNKTVLRKYASGPPVTLFVDAGGTVVHAKVGAFKDLVELKALTRRYLAVTL